MDKASGEGCVRRRFRRIVPRVALSLTVLVLLDALLGVTLCRNGRFLGRPLPPYALTFNEEQVSHLRRMRQSSDSYGQFDPQLGWSMRPHGKSANGLFSANSAGFRANREYALETPPGITRIAAFGDSYTHGDTVANDQTWTHLLEQSNPNLEVLNFGVNGFGTDQAYLRYLRDGVQFHPEIVLIGLMAENIMRNTSVYRPAYSHGTDAVAVKPRFRMNSIGTLEMVPCPVSSPEELATLVESKRLLDTLYETDYWVARAPKAYQGSVLFWSSMVRIVYAGYERWHPPGYYYQHVTSEPFQVTARILKDFHAKALDDGAERAIVLIFPGEGEIQDQLDGKPPFWSTMTNHLQSAGVPVVDLAPPLTEVVRREGMDAYYRVGHLSPKGNAVVADTLLKALFPSYTAEGVR